MICVQWYRGAERREAVTQLIPKAFTAQLSKASVELHHCSEGGSEAGGSRILELSSAHAHQTFPLEWHGAQKGKVTIQSATIKQPPIIVIVIKMLIVTITRRQKLFGPYSGRRQYKQLQRNNNILDIAIQTEVNSYGNYDTWRILRLSIYLQLMWSRWW